MSLETLERWIDQRVSCTYCYRTVRSSQLAEHVAKACKKAPARRLAGARGRGAAVPAQQQGNNKPARPPSARAEPVRPNGATTGARHAGPALLLPRQSAAQDWYSLSEFKLISDAYKHIFGTIGPELRAYWDLDRKRPWACVTTDFGRATYGQHLEATRLAIEIERTVADPLLRGRALRDVTRQTGVGLSLGMSPWTDQGLFQTYARNQHKRRLTIILGHDCYPIVPLRAQRQHPVDAPLRRGPGLHGHKPYINAGGVPAAILDKSELLLFLNFVPDYRPPNTKSTGPFKPYDRCAEGFQALLQAVTREFKVQIISWTAPVWAALSERFLHRPDPEGVCVRAMRPANFGRPLELLVGRLAIPYLPLAHPCETRNFTARHAAHAHEGYLRMGLGGRAGALASDEVNVELIVK